MSFTLEMMPPAGATLSQSYQGNVMMRPFSLTVGCCHIGLAFERTDRSDGVDHTKGLEEFLAHEAVPTSTGGLCHDLPRSQEHDIRVAVALSEARLRLRGIGPGGSPLPGCSSCRTTRDPR